jgi:HK97 family phage portal protein
MIVTGALTPSKPSAPPPKLESVPDQGGSSYAGRRQTRAKQPISPELAKRVATYFRCLNGISDDIASMPIQHIRRVNGRTEHIAPDANIRNMAYLIEVSSNRWLTPFMLKRTATQWLLSWGNALIWQPAPPAQRELFILPSNVTTPKMDPNGYLWYEVRFPNGDKKFIPAIEVMHLMINSTNGIWGRSVLEYASETVGLRMGMSATQSSVQGQGLNPAAYIQVNATLDKKGRDNYREAYSDGITGADNAGSLIVFDNKVTKFEPITMQFRDAQFLESMNSTDMEIANFFKYPAYKLNMGKQSYQSNEQQDLDYLKSTLDPHLVQWEQAARLRWVSEAEQKNDYFKFVRESILRTNAKNRAELHEIEMRTGLLTANEARAHEDRDSYADGDKFWMTKNNGEIGAPQNAKV